MRTVLLLLCLAALAPPALASTAECGVDLDRGRFVWVLPGGVELAPIDVPGARERLAALDSLLAAGDPADRLRTELGREILGPHLDDLARIEEWKFVPELVQALPGTLGSLAVLELPDGGGAALARHRISLGWPRPLQVPVPRQAKSAGAVLLSAPFATDVDPALDDPDTLRMALRRTVRSIRMVPRNETGAQVLRRALEDSDPGLWWFRGEDHQFAGLQPALGALPSVVVWTLPSRASAGPPSLTPVTLASGGTGPACVIVSTRAVAESALAPLARDFIDGLARGLDCGTALHEAQRQALSDGTPLPVASSLIAIGRTDAVADLKRASWLQRWLH